MYFPASGLCPDAIRAWTSATQVSQSHVFLSMKLNVTSHYRYEKRLTECSLEPRILDLRIYRPQKQSCNLDRSHLPFVSTRWWHRSHNLLDHQGLDILGQWCIVFVPSGILLCSRIWTVWLRPHGKHHIQWDPKYKIEKVNKRFGDIKRVWLVVTSADIVAKSATKTRMNFIVTFC